MNIEYHTDSGIDNAVWQLLEKELLDNVDPKNAQYPSWWHHCDLINIFEFGVCDAIRFHIGKTN